MRLTAEPLHVRTCRGSELGANESVRARCRDPQMDFLKCRLDTALIRRYEERRLGLVFERPPNLVAPSAKLFRSRLTPPKTEANSLLISFPAV